MSAAQDERQKVNQKLEELKNECLEKMAQILKPRDDSTEMKSENLLEKIRLEIFKLENKIESDMKNIVRNNSERDKCDKNFQTTAELKKQKSDALSEALILPQMDFLNGKEFQVPHYLQRVYSKNDLSSEKWFAPVKTGRESVKFQNQIIRKKFGEAKGFKKLTNDYMVGR